MREKKSDLAVDQCMESLLLGILLHLLLVTQPPLAEHTQYLPLDMLPVALTLPRLPSHTHPQARLTQPRAMEHNPLHLVLFLRIRLLQWLPVLYLLMPSLG
jgi:hypothetical protein